MEQEEEIRERVLREFNSSTLDNVGPVGGEQGNAVLQNMNQLQSDHNEIVKSLASRGGMRSNMIGLGEIDEPVE